MRTEYVEAVLDVVALIPAGRVLSYGDIAALLESGGPRQVGAVMSGHGSAVPWWRVVRASGQPPICHDARALVHYREEFTALHGEASLPSEMGGERPVWRVDMKVARWNPTDAQMEAIDLLAARLHAVLAQDAAQVVDVAQVEASDPSMSEPCDGLSL